MSDVLTELQPSPKKTKTVDDDLKVKTSPIKKLAVEDDENMEQTTPKEVLRFAKLSDKAFAPTRGSTKAAGYDLYSAYDVVVRPKGKLLCDTDLQVAIPEGCYGRVAPRSGLAVKHFIDVGAGVVDSDYRGHLKVLLFNFGEEPFEVKRGERIAQLICERVCLPDLLECTSLDETER
uniref:Deoxyuridine 5'-triphosphate nucleotidohydrolase n=1 Tax=Plectus sambesii TaxID=2011161 RepID=A0A914XMU9_9BILA